MSRCCCGFVIRVIFGYEEALRGLFDEGVGFVFGVGFT